VSKLISTCYMFQFGTNTIIRLSNQVIGIRSSINDLYLLFSSETNVPSSTFFSPSDSLALVEFMTLKRKVRSFQQ